MALHVFVVMPFGQKEGIDFDKVYNDYIRPALSEEGYKVFRADEERCAGEIRADMFQELLIADLVIADLSIDNPNVWYELGVRHALRARGILLIQSKRENQPFDTYTDRKLRYHIKNGAPDNTHLKQDKEALTAMARATISCWQGKKISPVFDLLPYLQEPDWKSLKVGRIMQFWEQHDDWVNRIAQARKSGYIGDILILAEEAPVSAFRSEARIIAGKALRKAERFDFALEQLKLGLAINPANLDGQREKGICLQRLALAKVPGYSLDQARSHYRKVLDSTDPKDSETCALLGRVDKDAWIAMWNLPENSPGEKQKEAREEDALLRKAIESYATGFRLNPAHYYSGINALTLMHIHRHLTGDERYDRHMHMMQGAVRFAAECELNDRNRYWSAVTIGDVEVLVGSPETVKTAYMEAIAYNESDFFALNSSHDQLLILRNLGFRSENVEAGIETFDRALSKLRTPQRKWQPEKVFLFSGHMIDLADRPEPRFPAGKEHEAAQKIAEVIDRLGTGTDDLALTQGACGGDLLFTEACMEREVKVHWMQPFREPEFILNSVAHGGDAWRKRYHDAKKKLASPIRSAPVALGEPPVSSHKGYPYERCNLWLLYTALSYGIDKVHFVCLWNGGGGDGPGGTAHMYNEVNKRTGNVSWIDTRTL